MTPRAFLLLLAAGAAERTAALNNGAARKPPMGWLSWQRFRCYTDCDADPENCLSEKLLKTVADHMVDDGYRDAGYTLVALDSCWWSPTAPRDAAGHMQADPTRFPSGIAGLASYMAERGLELGTCAWAPAAAPPLDACCCSPGCSCRADGFLLCCPLTDALMEGGCAKGHCDGPVFLDGPNPAAKSPHWATDVADLVKWGVKSLKVDSVEIANVTHAFNQTYPELSDSLVQAGYTGV